MTIDHINLLLLYISTLHVILIMAKWLTDSCLHLQNYVQVNSFYLQWHFLFSYTNETMLMYLEGTCYHYASNTIFVMMLVIARNSQGLWIFFKVGDCKKYKEIMYVYQLVLIAWDCTSINCHDCTLFQFSCLQPMTNLK